VSLSASSLIQRSSCSFMPPGRASYNHGLSPTLLEGMEDHAVLVAHQQQDIRQRGWLPSGPGRGQLHCLLLPSMSRWVQLYWDSWAQALVDSYPNPINGCHLTYYIPTYSYSPPPHLITYMGDLRLLTGKLN